jgi:hypothetical protein
MYSRPRRPEEQRDEPRPARAPEPVEAQRLLALQRSAGNAAVARMLTTAPNRMIARETDIVWGSDDLTRVLHIMPWKHGWDELIDVELAMVDDKGKLRSENKGDLTEEEGVSLKADYAKACEWMKRVFRNKAGRKRTADMPKGETWEFSRTFPKEETRRGVQSLTVVVKGFRPKVNGMLQDRYIVGDAWVETDRQDYLKANGWNATGYVAPVPPEEAGVEV